AAVAGCRALVTSGELGRQSRGGEFRIGRQSKRHQSGENIRLEFHPVDRDMHRYPIHVVARHPQYSTGGTVGEFPCHRGHKVLVIGMNLWLARLTAPPVVE